MNAYEHTSFTHQNGTRANNRAHIRPKAPMPNAQSRITLFSNLENSAASPAKPTQLLIAVCSRRVERTIVLSSRPH